MPNNNVASTTLEMLRRYAPEAGALARWVSLASRIDRSFLRKVRLEMLPGSSAAAEAELWFSPLVESWSARAFVLKPAVAFLLQQELVEENGRLERAWALTRERHPRISALLALEERVRWLALVGSADADAEIAAELRRVARTTMEREDMALGIGSWAAVAFSRLPPRVRTTEAAGELWIAATTRLTQSLVSPPEGMQLPRSARWLVPRVPTRQTSISIRRTSSGLHLLSDGSTNDAATISLPVAIGSYLEVRWSERLADDPHVVIFYAGEPYKNIDKLMSYIAVQLGLRVDAIAVEHYLRPGRMSIIGRRHILLLLKGEGEIDSRLQTLSQGEGLFASRVLTVHERDGIESIARELTKWMRAPIQRRQVVAANPGTTLPVPPNVPSTELTHQDGLRWNVSWRYGRPEPEIWDNVAWIAEPIGQTAYRAGHLFGCGEDLWVTAPTEPLRRSREVILVLGETRWPA